MWRFLRQQLSKDNLKLNEDGFEMLCADFFGSRHFYERAEQIKKRIGKARRPRRRRR